MYSLEEAEKELEENQKEESVKVIKSLPSFKENPFGKRKFREPSFFKKIFASAKLNRVHSAYNAFGGGNDEGSVLPSEKLSPADNGNDNPKAEEPSKSGAVVLSNENTEEVKDDSEAGEAASDLRKGETTNDDEGSIDEEDRDDNLEDEDMMAFDDERYPSMPKVGKPVNIDRLVNRTKAASYGIKQIVDMVNDDVALSVHRARNIPVSKEYDRVQVTKEISTSMAKVRSSDQIHSTTEQNLQEIQKVLNYRKSGLVMVNVNYSNKFVRKIDPIYVAEARTIIQLK